MKINITIDEKNHELDLRNDLYINKHSLQREFVEHSSKFAYYASLAVYAESEVNTLTQKRDILFATLYRKIKDKSEVDLTETAVKQEINKRKKFIILNRKLNKAIHTLKMLKVAKESFEHRKDMLIQLGSLAKKEYRSDISIKK